MKKSNLAVGIALAITAGTANAAFLQAGSTGTIDLNAGCFTFGDCSIGGLGAGTDNAITVRGFGTSVGGDGLVGQIGFTVGANGNDLTITSYQQDAYVNTAGGNFALTDFSGTLAGFSGFISDTGDVSLTLNRAGYPFNFGYLDGAQWNVDDSAVMAAAGAGNTQTGTLDALTTGFDHNWTPGQDGVIGQSGTGSALVAAGAGAWTGNLVNFGNVGAAWGAFDSNPLSEKFDITVNGVAAAVPVPAAVWLFGSGLLGLVGVARRKKA